MNPINVALIVGFLAYVATQNIGAGILGFGVALLFEAIKGPEDVKVINS